MDTSERKWKFEKKIFSSLDNWIWIGCFKFSLLSREYLPSGGNVLTNGLKILDTTKAHIFELKSSQSDEKSDKTTAMQISVVIGTL